MPDGLPVVGPHRNFPRHLFALGHGRHGVGMAWLAAKRMRRPPVTGAEGLVGEVALAKTDVAPRGQVFLHGELWEAISEAPIRQGEEAEVKSVKGLTLNVAPRHK